MTTYHGKVTTMKVDDAGDVERDISTFVTDVSVDFQKGSAESTAKGSAAQTHKVGHYGATISFSGRWDDTATTGPDVVLMGLLKDDDPHDFEIGFGGDDTGQRLLTGKGYLTAYTPSSPLAGIVDFSGTILVTDTVTEATG